MLDLADPAEVARLSEFLATADVVISKRRPSLAGKLGIESTAWFPHLVIGSITGGVRCRLLGFDIGAFWARSGLLGQTTSEGSAPLALTGGYGGLMTGLAVYAALLSGLLERSNTGFGRLIDTSFFRVVDSSLSGDIASQIAYAKTPRARPREKSRTPLMNCYRTVNDRCFFLTAVEACRHFENVCRAIIHEDLIPDEHFAKCAGYQWGHAQSAPGRSRERQGIFSCGDANQFYFNWPGMLARASADAALVPGDVIGTGTCGSDCLIELRISRGKDNFPWLKLGDRVAIEAPALGILRNAIA